MDLLKLQVLIFRQCDSMIKNNRNNEQIYGRNDMIMLDPNNKIYGSLGLADKYVMKTEEGTRLILSNPKLGSFSDVLTEFNIYGMSSQNKTTGKNLLKYPYIMADEMSQGIIFTDNKNGSISASGTATGAAYYNFYRNIDGKRLTLASGTYKLVVKGRNKCNVVVSNDVSTAVNVGTFTITDGHNEIYCYISIQEGVTVDETIYPMIQLASITDESYEPYTGGKPSPSPEYPQEIKSVVNPVIKVRGKNLFDFSRLVSDGVNVMDYDNQTITIPAYTNNTGYNQTLRDLCPGITPGIYVFSVKRSNPESGDGSYFLEAELDFNFNIPTELTDELLDLSLIHI